MSDSTSLLVPLQLLQMLFYATVGTVAVLTYLSARKTVLQPMRTEIFKQQLKLFTEILEHFAGKSEQELREQWAFRELLEANASKLWDEYGLIVFGTETDPRQRPYSPQRCPSSLVSGEALESADDWLKTDSHDTAGDYGRPRRPAASRLTYTYVVRWDLADDAATAPAGPPPPVPTAHWATYAVDGVCLPKAFTETQRRLHQLIESPVVTTALARLLKRYLRIVDQNVGVLWGVLADAVPEMATKYPTAEHLKDCSSNWLNNRFTHQFVHLEDCAKEISDYVRDYFQTEHILDR